MLLELEIKNRDEIFMVISGNNVLEAFFLAETQA